MVLNNILVRCYESGPALTVMLRPISQRIQCKAYEERVISHSDLASTMRGVPF
jgi:hypothetical protein